MINQLKAKKIPITESFMNAEKITSISAKLSATLARFPELKETAKKVFSFFFLSFPSFSHPPLLFFSLQAITSYARSVYLAPNKAVFDVNQLDLTGMANSMGLASIPKLHLGSDKKNAGETSKEKKEKKKKTERKGEAGKEDEEEEKEDDEDESLPEGDGEKSWYTSRSHRQSTLKLPPSLMGEEDKTPSSSSSSSVPGQPALKEQPKRQERGVTFDMPITTSASSSTTTETNGKKKGTNRGTEEDATPSTEMTGGEEAEGDLFDVRPMGKLELPDISGKELARAATLGNPFGTLMEFGDDEDESEDGGNGEGNTLDLKQEERKQKEEDDEKKQSLSEEDKEDEEDDDDIPLKSKNAKKPTKDVSITSIKDVCY